MRKTLETVSACLHQSFSKMAAQSQKLDKNLFTLRELGLRQIQAARRPFWIEQTNETKRTREKWGKLWKQFRLAYTKDGGLEVQCGASFISGGVGRFLCDNIKWLIALRVKWTKSFLLYSSYWLWGKKKIILFNQV